MSVKDNQTKFEQDCQRWWPRTGVAGGGPRYQNLSKIAKKKPFWGRFKASLMPWWCHAMVHFEANEPFFNQVQENYKDPARSLS